MVTAEARDGRSSSLRTASGTPGPAGAGATLEWTGRHA
ncbi:hypothetical protein [Azospirillum argentinense]